MTQPDGVGKSSDSQDLVVLIDFQLGRGGEIRAPQYGQHEFQEARMPCVIILKEGNKLSRRSARRCIERSRLGAAAALDDLDRQFGLQVGWNCRARINSNKNFSLYKTGNALGTNGSNCP